MQEVGLRQLHFAAAAARVFTVATAVAGAAELVIACHRRAAAKLEAPKGALHEFALAYVDISALGMPGLGPLRR